MFDIMIVADKWIVTRKSHLSVVNLLLLSSTLSLKPLISQQNYKKYLINEVYEDTIFLYT